MKTGVAGFVKLESVLNQIVNNLNGYENALKDFGDKLMRSREVKILMESFQIDNFQSGVMPTGLQIGNYDKSTVAKKKKEGREYDFVTLYDTGEFYKSIYAAYGSDTIYIDSKDPKLEKIQAQYGQILGITEYQMKELANYMRPKFEEFTKDYIQMSL